MHKADGGSVEHYEVVVIGGGQAGLAIGYFLARQGRRFVILEAADSVAAAWRSRWDSLLLFTPRRYDALPGLPFPGDPDGYPTRDEVIAYLERYAATFELPVELESPVRSLDAGRRSLRGRARRPAARRRPGRRRDGAVPGAATCRRSPTSSRPRCSRCTAPATCARATSRRERSPWSAAGTPATRSRRSSPRHTGSTSRSARARRRCRRGSSAATCSGG